MSVLVFPSPAAMGDALVTHMERAAARAIEARGRFCCALTGGSAAEQLYPSLARAALDWAKVDFYLSDERCVPAGHADSNARQARMHLGATAARWHIVDCTRSPQEAAAAYEASLPKLDVVHLGVGPDGHVGSLFFGHPLLAERRRRVAALEDSPKPPAARVTLTLPALHEAGAIWFLVLGAAKREAVRLALRTPDAGLPAALAQRAASDATWFLDQAAAGGLTP